jgi:hypothetical protein
VHLCWLLPYSYEFHLVVVYVSQAAISLLCFPYSWSWSYLHGVGIKYISEVIFRVSIMSIYMLYGCWVI